MKPDQKGDILSKARREELTQQMIAEPFQEAYREFADRSTVAKRLEDREALSFTVQMTDGKWLTMIIVPQGYDKDGKLCTVLVANRDVTEEKKSRDRTGQESEKCACCCGACKSGEDRVSE